MHPIFILVIGVVVVVGGVLGLRLHAFLALTLAALVVGALTPPTSIEQHAIEKAAIKVGGWNEATGELVLSTSESAGATLGTRYRLLVRDHDSGLLKEVATATIKRFDTVTDVSGKSANIAIATVEPAGAVDFGQADVVAVHPLDMKAAAKLANQTVGERVANAFGNTCGKIGILIAMAAIIGKCLLDSGSADKIVRSALRISGERGAPFSFIGSGFLLGIPVFFDTVFYLMMPLGKALRMRTGRNYLLYVLTIVAGATMAHSLVPPTPGPLFVAEQLRVDIGLMIFAGCIVGLFSSSAGYLFAQFVNRRTEVPLRESPDFSLDDLKAITERDESQLPPLALALLPIVLPVVLIAGNTILKTFSIPLPSPALASILETLGNKNIALTIATAIAMSTLILQKATDLKGLASSVQSALASGGVIILITAAGGAFGGILQQTGVASLIRQLPTGSPTLVIVLAFLITTAVRTAQGSATVAMITAVGILSGIAESGALTFHPVFLALAIGCGSKPVAWMNDSGFWVICKMSGMTEAEGLKFVTPMSILMGVTGLIVTLIGATLFS